MTPERWQAVKELFLRVREESPNEQIAVLDEACANDPSLRSEVEALLSSREKAETFLEQPAIEGMAEAFPEAADSCVEGRRIGSYTLIREIASGGMGTVYEARQDQPNRVVALKVMRLGISSRSAAQRFQYESEILARLSHPAIAHVHEAGTHTEGKTRTAFFAMEFVPDASTITEYADANQLDTSRRLELFVDVCEAVHHGHQKGVIHRDLKPANILVTNEQSRDREGAVGSHESGPLAYAHGSDLASQAHVKVIDFGIARAVDPDGTTKSMQTVAGQLIGTLQYMSPEQLDGDSRELDTRSDVYSLGVVLFELLCGQLPYDVTKSSVYGAIKAIKEQAPAKPSVIQPSFRGDVETIIMKALEKNPRHRYQSVATLSGDIRRYLAGEAIEARRDSSLYVLRKSLYRYRRAVAVMVAAFIGLVTFGIVVSILWRSAELSRHEATILLGRSRIHQDDPINASDKLWGEFLKRDVPRTRLALLELYSRYPLLWGNADFGRQIDVAYSPSGKWLATVGGDGRLIVFEAKNGTVSQVIDKNRIHARCLAFSSVSPSVVFVGGTDGKVRILPFSEDRGAIGEEPLETLGASEGSVSCLAVSDDGERLAVGCVFIKNSPNNATSARSVIRLWSTTSYEERSSWTIECEGVADLAFSEDATKLAAGTITGCVELPEHTSGRTRVWSIEDGCLLHELHLTANPHHRAVLFSEDGARLYCGAEHVLRWDLEKNDTALLEGAAACGVRSIAAPCPSVGRHLALASGDGRIRFLDTRTDVLLPIQGFHGSAVSDDVDVCFSRDGKTVASVANDGVRVWRFLPATDMELPLSNRGTDIITSVDITRNSGLCLVATAPLPKENVTGGDSGSGSEDEQAALRKYCSVLWPSATSKPPVIFNGVNRGGLVAVSDNGDRVAILDQLGDAANRVVIFGISSLPTEIAFHNLKQELIAMLWLDEGGRVLLLGFEDGEISTWRVDETLPESESALERIHHFDSRCTRFALDGERRWLAACCEGGNGKGKGHVRLWKATGLPIGNHTFAEAYAFQNDFEAHEYVWTVALTQDATGRPIVATTGSSREVFLWDALTDAEITRMSGHKRSIHCCHALEDHLLVTASSDKTVRIWDTREQEEVCLLHQGERFEPITAVRGQRIAVADGPTVRIFDMDEIHRLFDSNRPYQLDRLSREGQPSGSPEELP